MSHWAEIDENNIVLRVVVGDNNDPVGDEGYKWLIDNLGGTWIKASYNGNIRGIFPGVGCIYDKEKDTFIYAPVPVEGVTWWFDSYTNKWERV